MLVDFTQKKNVAFLIRAFKGLVHQYPKSELWIIGDGFLKRELKNLARSLRIERSVRFIGRVEHQIIKLLYPLADVFVLPSVIETQGMVAIEAMFFAKPVIVTNAIVSASELVVNGENGYIVDHKNVDSLEEKLIYLKEHPAEVLKMGKMSRDHSRNFTTKTIIDDLEEIYYSLAGPGSKVEKLEDPYKSRESHLKYEPKTRLSSGNY